MTVVICAYNAAPYVGPAIQSILAQSFSDFELLIINDGSTDDTREIVLSFDDPRIRLVDNPRNLGIVASRNRGLEMARSELIASQDADDLSLPDRLRCQVAFMRTHAKVAVLGTAALIIDEDDRALSNAIWFKACTPLALRWQLIFDTPCLNSSVMMRRSVVWDKLRGYDDRFTASEDFELFSRVAVEHDLANLEDELVKYRIVPLSLTSRRQNEVIQRVREVIRGNLLRYLQLDHAPEEWLDTWIRLIFRQYPFPKEARQLMREVHRFHKRFVEVHPNARHNPEIRRHMVYTAVRIAGALMPVDWLGSLLNSIVALRLDPVMASSTLARVGLSRFRRANARTM